MGDFAKDHTPPQGLFTGIIGGRHRLIVEEEQQMLSNLLNAQSAWMPHVIVRSQLVMPVFMRRLHVH